MIRFLSLTLLIALAMLVFYVPTIFPTQRYIDQLRTEEGLNQSLWNEAHATRILSRIRNMRARWKQDSLSAALEGSPRNTADELAANEMAGFNERISNHPYFRSIDALLALATYRLSTLIEWTSILLVFTIAVLFDGYLLRMIRSKEFLQRDPELFALHAGAAIMMGCATAIGLVLPVTLHPLLLSLAPLSISAFASRVLSQFHRRG